MQKYFIVIFMIIFFVFVQVNSQVVDSTLRVSSIETFNPVFHFSPVNQDTTYVCWSFSTISFIESEMHRLGKDEVRLSVMYPVYFSFIEKAKYFIKTKGKSRFKAGDLFGTVIHMIEKYGIVPNDIYSGKTINKMTYNHNKLYSELYNYMDQIKLDSMWDEAKIIENVKKILDRHMGTPPENFKYKGQVYSPKQFAEEIVQLEWEKYVKITSFKYAPFYKKCIFKVPDNWSSDSSYVNVPLAQFYMAIKNALKRNYSVAIDGDISEPGRIQEKDICIIPDYDIPSNSINQDAREYRFEKELTTDDHLMHIVGYKRIGEKDWFLIKDSWRDAFAGKFHGYFFMSDDYIKLKVLAFLTHEDAIPEIMAKIR